MLVSIVVPIYKVEKYLSNCIESILKQTFRDFELILVDDGSPDKCGVICDEFAKKDSRIKVLHQQNEGLSAARNRGIEVAEGEYITFIDSDDFVFPYYLEKLVDLIKTNDADMSVCDFIRCSSNDFLKDVPIKLPEEDVEIFTENRMEAFFISKKISTTAWGKLYKRFIFTSIKYPVGKYNEDVFVTYKTVHLSSKVVCCRYQGYVYRKNADSIINESFSLKKVDSIDGCCERAAFVEKEYPKLKTFAYRAIIYSCNQVLFSMGKSNVYDSELLNRLQRLYRMYLVSYLLKKSTLFGKLFALISFVDVRFSYKLVKILSGKTGLK